MELSELQNKYEKNKQDYLAPYLNDAIQQIEALQRVHNAAIAYRKCHWIEPNVVELDRALALVAGEDDE